MPLGSGSTAEEVAVFTAPDEETARTTEENVQSFLDDQSDSFEKYIPEETKRISNAVSTEINSVFRWEVCSLYVNL